MIVDIKRFLFSILAVLSFNTNTHAVEQSQEQALSREEAQELEAKLDWCDCRNAYEFSRVEYNQKVLEYCLENFPPQDQKKLHISSFGSGYLRQEHKLLKVLKEHYSDISIRLIDSIYNTCNGEVDVKALPAKLAFSALHPGVEIKDAVSVAKLLELEMSEKKMLQGENHLFLVVDIPSKLIRVSPKGFMEIRQIGLKEFILKRERDLLPYNGFHQGVIDFCQAYAVSALLCLKSNTTNIIAPEDLSRQKTLEEVMSAI